MLIRRLLHRFLNDTPGDTGGTGTGAPADPPAADPPADPPAVDSAAAPAPADPPAAPEPKDPFAALNAALDTVSKPTEAPPPEAKAPAAPAPGPTPAPPPASEDLTPPEGMTERAAERWSKLTERVKLVPELERRATEAEEGLTAVRTLVQQSGLNEQEFSDMLATGRLLKSDKPEDLQAALTRLDAIRTDIAVRMGKDVPGTDPLSAHPDLLGEVESLSLTRERALEIVKLRNQERNLTQTTEQQREVQQFQQQVSQAAGRMDAALASRANTPGHAQKVAFIQSKLADPQYLQGFVKRYTPEQWEGAVLDLYDAYNPPAPAAPAPPQPLRPGNVRAGGPVRTGPVTAESAIAAAASRLGI